MPSACARFASSTGSSGMCEMIQRRFVIGISRVHGLAVRDQGCRAGEVQRVIFAAPARSCDRAQAVDAAAGELADAAGPQPVVAEERERVPQPRRERRQRRVGGGGVLVQEVDPQPGRQSPLAIERDERDCASCRCSRWRCRSPARRQWNAPGVTMRRDAELRVVLQRVERRALPACPGSAASCEASAAPALPPVRRSCHRPRRSRLCASSHALPSVFVRVPPCAAWR